MGQTDRQTDRQTTAIDALCRQPVGIIIIVMQVANLSFKYRVHISPYLNNKCKNYSVARIKLFVTVT